jgi:acyl CoA:acetate/3-ketoacid CoA transferase beta subunit
MDLVASAEILSAMMHVNKQENLNSKKCTLPLTGVGYVKAVVTELVLEVTPNGFRLLEKSAWVSVEEIIRYGCPINR